VTHICRYTESDANIIKRDVHKTLIQKYWILTYAEDGLKTRHTIEFNISHWALFILYTR